MFRQWLPLRLICAVHVLGSNAKDVSAQLHHPAIVHQTQLARGSVDSHGSHRIEIPSADPPSKLLRKEALGTHEETIDKREAGPRTSVSVEANASLQDRSADSEGSASNSNFTALDRMELNRVLSLEVDRWMNLKSHATIAKAPLPNAHFKLPQCKFSRGRPRIPAWQDPITERFRTFLKSLENSGLVMVMAAGSLLGAYRHHGVIPYDEDLDLIFDVCENLHAVRTSSSKLRRHSCQELAKMQAHNPKFAERLWKEVLAPRLKGTDIVMVESLDRGFRLSNGEKGWDGGVFSGKGVGADVGFAFSNFAAPHAMCRCTFGDVEAFCPVESEVALQDLYGKNYMKPKNQCDYYADLGHEGWNHRTVKECEWATQSLPIHHVVMSWVDRAIDYVSDFLASFA